MASLPSPAARRPPVGPTLINGARSKSSTANSISPPTRNSSSSPRKNTPTSSSKARSSSLQERLTAASCSGPTLDPTKSSDTSQRRMAAPVIGPAVSTTRAGASGSSARKKATRKVSRAFLRRAGKTFKRNDWNTYRITCKGNHLKIEVNGVVTTDIKDDKDSSGVIGIQHHGEKGQTYKFRNLRIKEIK